MSPRGRVAALEASNDLIFDGDELEGDLALSNIEGNVKAVPPLVRPPKDDLDNETDYARSRLSTGGNNPIYLEIVLAIGL